MSLDDFIRYGPSTWYWLTARPWIFMIVGAVLLATGVYYTLRPVSKIENSFDAGPLGSLIHDPAINLDAGKITLAGTFSRGGKDLNAYVTYGSAGGPIPQQVLSGPVAMAPRIKLGHTNRFDKGERAAILIGTIVPADGNQNIVEWGDRNFTAERTGITWASNFGCIILVEQNGRENSYPFAIISRSVGGAQLRQSYWGLRLFQSV